MYGMLAAIPTVLILIVIGGRWVAGKAIAPVEEIRQAAAQITAQRLDQRLPVPPTGDEIAGLIEVLNAAFERLQRSFEQSVRFSADASHHLKTPIAVLRAGIEEIMADPTGSLTDPVRRRKGCSIGFISSILSPTIYSSWHGPTLAGSSCTKRSSISASCSRACSMMRAPWPSHWV